MADLLGKLGLLGLFAVYFASSAVLLALIVDASRRGSIWEGFEDALENKWAISAVLDLVLGFLFANMQIVCRASVAQQAVRSVPLIIAIWFLGSPIVLAWCVWLIVSPRSGSWDIHRALCPIPLAGSTADEESGPLNDANSSSLQSNPGVGEMIVGGFWFLCALFFFIACGLALADEPFAAGLAYALEHRWILVTWVDVLVGLLFTATFIAVRETRGGTTGWLSATFWLAALVLLGNGATALYCAWIARQAFNSGRSFRSCLLSQKQ